MVVEVLTAAVTVMVEVLAAAVTVVVEALTAAVTVMVEVLAAAVTVVIEVFAAAVMVSAGAASFLTAPARPAPSVIRQLLAYRSRPSVTATGAVKTFRMHTYCAIEVFL